MSKLILEYVSKVKIPATTEPLSIEEKFKLKKDGGICFSINENFTMWFGKKVEDPIAEQTLDFYKLLEGSEDAQIINGLGGITRAQTTLTEVSILMENQKQGEDGDLLNNGLANIFHIDMCWVVSVSWSDGGWVITMCSIRNQSRWAIGSRVFSRSRII